ncbi:DUF7717 family protein [Bradyrhizobium elkanii]|uniref:Uncharacterized protein n=1 Tax=Bradyrhizobium diazoefficiens TaxID=1355477 RepID=A0A810CVW3_9BRAD|nr:hypothetical protein XF1B_47840 [Bradyrhizobium diazoefficiens]BCE48368.1 hypothetical protein XF4B_47170 [Bradyrhizobium diazoefficiens]BCE91884.1 hypothetical protein XF10B_46820 [Bradyrhizobium diazoefficiens]BCF26812.1 hypothetical protein XF14B_47640 [Bradyrhizobium diazoefficiens]
MPDLQQAIQTFFEGCKRIAESHRQANYPRNPAPEWKLQELQKRFRIVNGSGVHCFVDKATGDVLKAETWARPAKHARGNVFDEHNGLAKMGPYGPAYLR